MYMHCTCAHIVHSYMLTLTALFVALAVRVTGGASLSTLVLDVWTMRSVGARVEHGSRGRQHALQHAR